MNDPLIAAALAVRKNAFAPFSKFLVGAAVDGMVSGRTRVGWGDHGPVVYHRVPHAATSHGPTEPPATRSAT